MYVTCVASLGMSSCVDLHACKGFANGHRQRTIHEMPRGPDRGLRGPVGIPKSTAAT